MSWLIGCTCAATKSPRYWCISDLRALSVSPKVRSTTDTSASPLDRINTAIRNAGFVWQPCTGCGIDWPFPKGYDPTHAREFLCAVCVNALLTEYDRRTEMPHE